MKSAISPRKGVPTTRLVVVLAASSPALTLHDRSQDSSREEYASRAIAAECPTPPFSSPSFRLSLSPDAVPRSLAGGPASMDTSEKSVLDPRRVRLAVHHLRGGPRASLGEATIFHFLLQGEDHPVVRVPLVSHKVQHFP